MKKREIRERARTAIIKEGLTHNQAYEKITEGKNINVDGLAEELSKIPSRRKIEKTLTLRYTYLACLVIIIVLRALGIFVYGQISTVDPGLMLLLILLGLIVPGIGIFAVATFRGQQLISCSVLLGIGIVRSYSKGQLSYELSDLIVLIPTISAIVLGIVINQMWRVKYESRIEEYADPNGNPKKIKKYIYEEDENLSSDDVLDSEL